MKISELAHASNVPAKTIRYYEQIKLISAAERDSNGYRSYQRQDIATLVFIRRCRELNIAIDDIKQLLDIQATPAAPCSTVDDIIARQLAKIKQKQRELALLETSLSELATSCVNHKIEDCSILHQLRAG
ncbi:MerR family transcriptional regulator [Alteromonas ponticola]|uniref:MerR family transcriptional regulator n=1 Tax=Alteromonas ponticola TaxID=2720613 RepID=A0ABX1R4F5_9ALTE|nr:MerR family transcriptional regulator [Alteromonas ponticola]NMH60939.1 MerR family transcriptional regulator [Alteromonas ponticola]